jgi:hypothetical protein
LERGLKSVTVVASVAGILNFFGHNPLLIHRTRGIATRPVDVVGGVCGVVPSCGQGEFEVTACLAGTPDELEVDLLGDTIDDTDSFVVVLRGSLNCSRIWVGTDGNNVVTTLCHSASRECVQSRAVGGGSIDVTKSTSEKVNLNTCLR